jgi:two-component system cell cycle sensor histidine kinase/response regulator CckA
MQKMNSIASDDVREAIQRFSGRIAHDFNNLLTPLLAYPEMIASSLPADSLGHKLLNALETAASAAVDINRRLGDLSGMMRSEKRQLNIAETVESVISDLKMSPLAEGVEIKTELASTVEANLSQDALSMSVEECCRNGLQAVNGQGRLDVRVACRDLNVGFETVGGQAPAGTYAIIEIKDNGCGMSADDLSTAIEPFSSNFGGGKRFGAGLGLSIAYCALRENGAFLSLESEQGIGTTATIYIPNGKVSKSAPSAAEGATTVAADVESKLVPRILVVDDEPSIVNLFKLILENYIHGAVVEKAMNGEEALTMFKSEPYDVIVMDLHMPVMDGQTAFVQIEAICAERGWHMPSVVFCTGYAPRDTVKKAVAGGTKHLLLNKPVRSETLVEAVQTRLESETR